MEYYRGMKYSNFNHCKIFENTRVGRSKEKKDNSLEVSLAFLSYVKFQYAWTDFIEYVEQDYQEKRPRDELFARVQILRLRLARP